MVSTLTSPLTGMLNFIGILTTENDLRGVDILRNDVYAILKQIMKSNFMKNKRRDTEPPETDSLNDSNLSEL